MKLQVLFSTSAGIAIKARQLLKKTLFVFDDVHFHFNFTLS